MRLIHLAAYGGAYPGSFIPMVRSILDAGRRRGWNVEAVFSEVANDKIWLNELREEGFICRLAPTRRSGRGQMVKRFIATDEPLILHTHFASFDLPAAAAARRGRNVIAYWHKHGALLSGARLRNTVKLGLLSKGVEEILCVAPNVLDDARRCLAPSDRLTLVPNAIDLARFPLVTPEQRRRARETLALPLEVPIILHLGWDWRRKGGDIFLEAVASLARSESMHDTLAITIADAQPARRLAQSLGIADRVRVLPPRDDVQTLYAAADVFAAPSRAEGHPFAVAEAIASGLPVVASPIAGHDMIAESMQACRIAALDQRAFADAIAATLALPAAEREHERMASRARIVAEMDIGAWSERMMVRYEGALERRSLPAPAPERHSGA
jgi:glycosyltransferase involved in cell wall biosynthesis